MSNLEPDPTMRKKLDTRTLIIGGAAALLAAALLGTNPLAGLAATIKRTVAK